MLKDWDCRFTVCTLGVNSAFSVGCTTINELRNNIVFHKSIQKVYDCRALQRPFPPILHFLKIHNFYFKIRVKQVIDFSTSFLAFKNSPSSIVHCQSLKFLFQFKAHIQYDPNSCFPVEVFLVVFIYNNISFLLLRLLTFHCMSPSVFALIGHSNLSLTAT